MLGTFFAGFLATGFFTVFLGVEAFFVGAFLEVEAFFAGAFFAGFGFLGIVAFFGVGFVIAGFFSTGLFASGFLAVAGFFADGFSFFGAVSLMASLLSLKDPLAPTPLVWARRSLVTILFRLSLI